MLHNRIVYSVARRGWNAGRKRMFWTLDAEGNRLLDGLPAKRGMFDPRHERDACGLGFVADLNGSPTHTTVVQAIDGIERLDHRGARGSDELTGDGVGLVTQVPRRFFRMELDAAGVKLERDQDLGVGVVFLPGPGSMSQYAGGESGAKELRQAMVKAIEEEARGLGMRVLMWRKVPVGVHVLGANARTTLPDMQQLLLERPVLGLDGQPCDDDAYERVLFVLRKRAEKRVAALNDEAFRALAKPAESGKGAGSTKDKLGTLPFYVASMSHRTIAYKGLVLASNFRNFFADVSSSDFQSSLALFHQRFSTNTAPRWVSAQPFRLLAHNGEINSLTANINWAKMREETLRSSLYGDAFPELLPIIEEGGSDSAAMDNVLELLVRSGRDPVQAMSMMVPEAYENVSDMSPALRAYFAYQRTLMEPWDGPAALCFTDGRVAAAAMDRNGLRPLRYWVTSAGRVIVGSEVGLVDVPVEKVRERGRLGPGEMLSADVLTGRLRKNGAIKDELAAQRPYGAWLERSVTSVAKAAPGMGQTLEAETLVNVVGPSELRAKFVLRKDDAETAFKEAKAAALVAKKRASADGASQELIDSQKRAEEVLEAAKERFERAKAQLEALPEDVLESVESRARRKRSFGWTREDEEVIMGPASRSGLMPLGSMGDDTPLAAVSTKPQSIYRYFKQRFAEVTNPPIDPLLEKGNMSLGITFGRKGMLLEETQHASFLVRLGSPVITEPQLRWLRSLPSFRTETLSATFDPSLGPKGLEHGIRALCERAEREVDAGTSYLLLSDRLVSPDAAPIPMLLAVGAVHHHLISAKKRMRASILVESGDVREDHHVATLVGFGASVVHPYLAFEAVAERAAADAVAASLEAANNPSSSPTTPVPKVDQALRTYREALEKGLFRIMSKMGIATVDSYRGAQVFEILGLGKDVTDLCFPGTVARLPAVTLEGVGRDVLAWHQDAFGGQVEWKRGSPLERGGAFTTVRNGEFHAYNPLVFNKLRSASTSGDAQAYSAYADEVRGRPFTKIRDAFALRPTADGPIPIEEVESADSIVKRFCLQAMSHGAISSEAHEALAIAANRIGARSNSGEGGEDPVRYKPYDKDMPGRSKSEAWHPVKGDYGNSAIKQIASARFGVTASYCAHADQLEIKVAQAAKPGEGGQVPGFKVTKEIARLRHSTPGVTLISPPPHHDIYSIEDLKQLIYDLKRVNKAAEVSVKLVSQAGVGTIAAGVVKADADVVHIAGHDGGTGAASLGSIKHAGLPWELGLAEAQHVLIQNGLRGRVKLRVDGGFATGRDVVVAALMGADEYGFGTAALISLGCVMARKCHLNTCPVGIATQDPEMRALFKGHPDHVVTFLLHTAEQVRILLADLGLPSLEAAIGRIDLLAPRPELSSSSSSSPSSADSDADVVSFAEKEMAPLLYPKGVVDLSELLEDPDPTGEMPRKCVRPAGVRNEPGGSASLAHWRMGTAPPSELDETVWRACENFLDDLISSDSSTPGEVTELHFPITNAARSVGARLAGEIAKRQGEDGLGPNMKLRLRFHGVAGQSFGAFNGSGVGLELRGEAHDGVGKSMSGGEVVVRLPADASKVSSVLIGNVALYGATGGRLFVGGSAGERFAVRNSGATAVVEGVGDHGCEYCTGGTVVVLGSVGRNFAAGMSGGTAYVLDVHDTFLDRCNTDMVDLSRIDPDSEEARTLHALIQDHQKLTDSSVAAAVLDNWDDALRLFWHVQPETNPNVDGSAAALHVPNWTSKGTGLDGDNEPTQLERAQAKLRRIL